MEFAELLEILLSMLEDVEEDIDNDIEDIVEKLVMPVCREMRVRFERSYDGITYYVIVECNNLLLWLTMFKEYAYSIDVAHEEPYKPNPVDSLITMLLEIKTDFDEISTSSLREAIGVVKEFLEPVCKPKIGVVYNGLDPIIKIKCNEKKYRIELTAIIKRGILGVESIEEEE
jgi:hypothetical protein